MQSYFYVNLIPRVSHRFLCMYRKDITQWQEDMSFTFVIKWQEQFLFCHRNKIHTFKLMCNAPFIIKTYWWQCFWQIFQRFPKILQNFSKVTGVLPNIFYNFQRLQKIVFSSKTLVCNNRCLFSYYYQGNMQSRCFCSVRIWDYAVSCYSRDSYKWCNR